MIEVNIVLANRIRRELTDLERRVFRAEQVVEAVHERPQDQDFYVDSAALN